MSSACSPALRAHRLGAAAIALALVAAGPRAEPLPSYQAARDAYQAEQKTKAKKLDLTDWATIQEAKEALARNMPEPGLKAGEQAPDFTLPNASGEAISLHGLLAEGPLVLVFYRGAWCPYCNLQLQGLRDSIMDFRKHGGRLAAVTPQKPDRSLKQIQEDGYPFEILSDLDSHVMRDYHLYYEVGADLSDVYIRNFGLDLADYNGPGRYVLPVPGTFVIDRGGIIRAAWAEVDYTRRVEPAEILTVLKRLEREPAPPAAPAQSR